MALKAMVASGALLWTVLHLHFYPIEEMLWFCAYGNVVVAAGILAERPLLLSIEAVALLVPQILWTTDALFRLLTGSRDGGTSYLFDDQVHWGIRGLSLFHIVVPPLLLYVISRVGYDKRALRWQITIGSIVLLVSFARGPSNLNGVYAPLSGVAHLPPTVHLLGALIGFPLVCWLPTHIVLLRLYGAVRNPVRNAG